MFPIGQRLKYKKYIFLCILFYPYVIVQEKITLSGLYNFVLTNYSGVRWNLNFGEIRDFRIPPK